MSINKETEVLITRYLSGQCTPEEALAIDDLMNEDSSLKKAVFTIESTLPSALSIETINVYKRLAASEIINQNLIYISHKSSLTIYKIAAAFAVLLVSISLIYFSNDEPNKVETIRTFSETKSLTMIDQSKITLNRNSYLHWDEMFNQEERRLALQGEAYFTVSHNAAKPFILKMDKLEIRVLGTIFNVKEDTLLNTVAVYVTSGRVLMKDDSSEVIVEAGMKGLYIQETRELIIEGFFDKNDLAYATHSLTFNSASFEEVTFQLSRAYGVTCAFDESKFKNCSLTTDWNNKPLPFVLNIISEALMIQYDQSGNHVYFYGNGCQ